MILIKTTEELNNLRESGKILHSILEELQGISKEGVNLLEIDEKAGKLAKQHNAFCSFKGYKGFPSNACLSVNDEVVHSPAKNRFLQAGDILTIDIGITYQKMVTDSAVTFPIGNIPESTTIFLEVNKRTLDEVIKIIKSGVRVGDIGAFIQEKIEGAGYSVIQELTGHGVGRYVHEDPFIPNFGKRGTGSVLQKNMTIAVEPIIAMGNRKVKTDKKDGWTVTTLDGSLASQFEHTLIVHEDYAEVVT